MHTMCRTAVVEYCCSVVVCLLSDGNPVTCSAVSQAKEALKHPYFDDLDRVAVDALENPELEAFADN